MIDYTVVGPGGAEDRRGGAARLRGDAAAEDSFVWVEFDAPDPELLATALEALGLDRFSVDPAHTTHRRPKVETIEGALLVLVKTVWYIEATRQVETGDVTFYTDGFAGRIGVHPATLWSVLDDVVESLEEQGVRRIVLSNGHLEPAHVKVLRGVAADHPERSRHKAQVIFPDNTRRKWAETLGEEFKSGDCHAGSCETSVVLAADPDAVRAAWRELPPVAIGLLEKMKNGAGNFIEAGARDAYCGDPARASREEGEKTIAALARVIVESVREAWPDLFERAERR